MRTFLIVVVLGAIVVGAGVVLSDPKTGATAVATEARDTDCGTFGFDRYDAGQTVQGLPKSDTFRRCEPDVGAPSRINMVTSTYGSCEPTGGDGGCAPAVQVQSWPACERNLALYEKYPAPNGDSAEFTKATIRGAPAAIFDGGRRIEMFTGNATIVIFGQSSDLARAAADRLSGVHGSRLVRAVERLPSPVAGAVEGKLSC